MELGIDFGTTRTIVTFADRGNYPVVTFRDAAGDSQEFFPSLIALGSDGLLAGFAAQQARAEQAPVIRSIKRLLASPHVSPDTPVELGGQVFPLIGLVTSYLGSLHQALVSASSLSDALAEDPITTVCIAVPAHAHSGQRYLTLEAFVRAGFPVGAILNEPSAAGFEYTQRLGGPSATKRSRLVVYDLGGGTFDASLISIEDRNHMVLGTTGINHLGGDDFDMVLADLACERAGVSPEDLGVDGYFDLLGDVQMVKEQLVPQSRRIVVEVGEETVIIPVNDYYQRLTPLVDRSLTALTPLVNQLADESGKTDTLMGVYLVGGASLLPLVPRMLRESFGRRVYRSSYPAASTAIGLAIAADPQADYTLADRLSRGFGVFREADGGATVHFDPVFDRDQLLTGEVTLTRQYRAAHNIARFRFAEYTELCGDQPVGDIVPLPEVTFPCVRALQSPTIDLATVPVERIGWGDVIEEVYRIDRNGICSVTITDLETGWQAGAQLGKI